MFDAESNIVDLEKRLEAMSKASADLTPAWNDVGTWWNARQLTVFKTMNNGKWPLLDPQTEQPKRGILIRSGELLKAVSNKKPAFSSPTTARFGQSGKPGWYGIFHQTGKGVPKRQPVPPLTGQEVEEVVGIISDHIMEAK